jgi:ribosomal protein S20/6-pyruvoyl-tetrahydropterin synthase
MNKKELNQLINECVKEHILKNKLRTLVKEAMDEIKLEKKLSCKEMIDEIESEIKKANKDYSISLDDSGHYVFSGSPVHSIKLKHLYEDRFNVTYFKEDADRTKKVSLPFDDVKKFVKEVLSSKDGSYVTKAYNKAAEQSIPAKGKDGEMQETKEKVKDAVTDSKDLPDQPYREVGSSFKRQSEHSKKGTKADYTYPKQKNKKLKVKLPSKKQKSILKKQ